MGKRAKKFKTDDGLPLVVRYRENGLRCVEPYEYVFKTFAKGRWLGRTLIAVCVAEFIAHDESYYREAILSGKITINGKTVSPEYVFGDNDEFHHRTICVENPVSGAPVVTLFENASFLVVAKPSSIPVHACGGYRVNTLMSIIANEHGEDVCACHRIDRLTSGIVILGKNAAATRTVTEAMTASESFVNKIYLARVAGNFPSNEEIHVRGTISCIDARIGKYGFSSSESTEGKLSHTAFTRLKYFLETDESLVECRPVTGRTHQIRLHLESLGHPIANDICYGGKYDPNHPFAFPQIPSRQYDALSFCGGIFLHAHRYVIADIGLDVTAPPPPWATS